MRLLLLFALLIVGSNGNLQVIVDGKGAYNVTVNNQLWLRSARTAIYADNRWYSTDDNSLPLLSITTAQGIDPNLGAWNETLISYNLTRQETPTTVVAHIRQWIIASAFSFHLDIGNKDLTNTIALDVEQVRTVFPSFYVEKTDANDNRGYFTYSGAMTGSADKHAGPWTSTSKVVQSGMQGGPIVIFNLVDQGEGDTMVLSPFSHFMATSISQTNNVIEYGVMGSMSSVPASYSHAFMLYYTPRGVTDAVREWGSTMQQAFNRTTQNRLNDLTVNYLGYYTDNGGYYYYNTEQGMDYETTMVNIATKLPNSFHYIQLDSWWYFKGLGDGVSEWTARPDVFPDGLTILHRRLENIPLAAHNRYWAYDTVYKTKYSFALDVGNGKALPNSNDSFWLDLLTEARGWGLVLYEQDWLNVQTMEFRPTRTDINLGERWLMSMGAAADAVGINIQYCMSLPRHILQSLQIPRVTHARASDDYAVHLRDPKKSTWNIGITSLFADAVGLAPFKDVLWSTDNQPGSPYKPTAMEIFPDREILIATLSTGPVGPGDGISYTNLSRIMRCCRQDGLILKPDKPLTMLNALFSDWASTGEVQGELYSTYTYITDRVFQIVFASAMKKDYVVYPSMIDNESGVTWPYDNYTAVTAFDDDHPLDVSAMKCGDLSICLWYISPLWQFNDPARTKYALLGELNKWTAVSSQRFVSISTNPPKTTATIVVQGAASEIVPIAIYHSTLRTFIVNCPISSVNGQATLIITPTTVNCS